jgi:hypothetical protein
MEQTAFRPHKGPQKRRRGEEDTAIPCAKRVSAARREQLLPTGGPGHTKVTKRSPAQQDDLVVWVSRTLSIPKSSN